MRKAFTLIELLVVLVIMVFVMGMIIPQGSKMLSGFEKRVSITKDKQKLSKLKAMSFLEAKEENITLLGINYFISNKGVITKYEKSDDNH